MRRRARKIQVVGALAIHGRADAMPQRVSDRLGQLARNKEVVVYNCTASAAC